MFDEEPEGDPHGQCAAEIHRLTAENEQLRTTIVAALKDVHDYAAREAGIGHRHADEALSVKDYRASDRHRSYAVAMMKICGRIRDVARKRHGVDVSEGDVPAVPTESSVASKRFLFREYWNMEENFRPYRNMLHSLEDVDICQMSQLSELMEAAGLKDGDEIEITVRATGNRPFPDRIWKHVGPHRYEPVERSAATTSETGH